MTLNYQAAAETLWNNSFGEPWDGKLFATAKAMALDEATAILHAALSSLPTIQWCEVHESKVPEGLAHCETWVFTGFHVNACRIVPKHLIDPPGDTDG